jgi:signal transduction histidine kinase
VVQEALTNAAKHGGPGVTAGVSVAWGDRLVIEVRQSAPGPVAEPCVAALTTGSGLVGMGERVRAVGGELVAGPDGDGAFRVRAELPLAEAGEGR